MAASWHREYLGLTLLLAGGSAEEKETLISSAHLLYLKELFLKSEYSLCKQKDV